MDFLMSSGAPTAKFPVIGTVVRGVVTAMDKQQQTDIDGNLLTWENGQPRWQVVITLDTDERDPAIENDTGERRVYAKWKLIEAVRKAVRESGWDGPSLDGGTLAIKFVAEEPPARRGLSPTKLYAAKYTPPPAASTADLMDDDEPEPVSASAVADDDIPF